VLFGGGRRAGVVALRRAPTRVLAVNECGGGWRRRGRHVTVASHSRLLVTCTSKALQPLHRNTICKHGKRHRRILDAHRSIDKLANFTDLTAVSKAARWDNLTYGRKLNTHRKFIFGVIIAKCVTLLFDTSELAVIKVLTTHIFFKTSVTLERNEIYQSKDQIDISLEDLAILFCAFLTHLSPFYSYGGLRKLERSILSLAARTTL